MVLRDNQLWNELHESYSNMTDEEILYRHYVIILTVRRAMLKIVERTIGLPAREHERDMYFLDMGLTENLGAGILIRHFSDQPGQGRYSYYTYEPSSAAKVVSIRQNLHRDDIYRNSAVLGWVYYRAGMYISYDENIVDVHRNVLTITPESAKIILDEAKLSFGSIYEENATRILSLFRKYLSLMLDVDYRGYNLTLCFRLPPPGIRTPDFLQEEIGIEWISTDENSALMTEFLKDLRLFNRKPLVVLATFILPNIRILHSFANSEPFGATTPWRVYDYFDVYSSLEPEPDPVIGVLLTERAGIAGLPPDPNRLIASFLGYPEHMRDIVKLSNVGDYKSSGVMDDVE